VVSESQLIGADFSSKGEPMKSPVALPMLAILVSLAFQFPAFDARAEYWLQDSSTGVSPTGRITSAVYDPVNQQMVIFGGYTNTATALCDDTWALSLGSTPGWSPVPVSVSAPAWNQYSAIYDALNRQMVIFGGLTNGAGTNDTLMLPLFGSPDWSLANPAGVSPTARFSCAAVYDSANQRMVVFGGKSAPNVFSNEAWALSLSGTPAWTKLAPSGIPPYGLVSASAVYDPVDQRMIVFGGAVGNGIVAAVLNDTWALSLGSSPAWTQLNPSGNLPPARYAHSAIYDSSNRRMVVFGGSDHFANRFNDVWSLSLGPSPAWTQIQPTGVSPSARGSAAAVYDSPNQRMVVFGGTLGADYFNETWYLSLTLPATATPSPTFSPTPGPTPPFAASGLGKTVLAPVPVKIGQPLCLYFDIQPASTKVDLFGSSGEKACSAAFGSGLNACLATSSLAPGIYFARVDVIYPDGREEKSWQKVAVLK
jgi:hypothetical protein